MLPRAPALLVLLAGAAAAQYGTPPKASAQDYPAHANLPKLAIGAEYLVHSFSGGRETYIARDYLVVEVALFPAKPQTFALSASQFRLRINHRKPALAPEAPEFVAGSLKYPDWETHSGLHPEASVGPVIFGAPQPTERFPQDPRAPPPAPPFPPKSPDENTPGIDKQPPVPVDVLVVQTALVEGEHRGPAGGYLYFLYKGRTKSIRSLELEFTGPEGNVTLPLL